MVDVRPCPAIPAGPGQVITATFKHASADVMDLVLSNYPVATLHSGLSVLNPPTTDPTSSPETIGVTGNHPFWSLDRAEFVQAGELAIGERLQTLGGDIRWVQQKLPRPGPEPVYNLEVHGEHVYYVGNSGVLAHNASCWDKARKEYWKLEAKANLTTGRYSNANLRRMGKGLAPKIKVEIVGRAGTKYAGVKRTVSVSMEVHHTYLAQRAAGKTAHEAWNLTKVTPWAHEAMDKFRHVGWDLKKIFNGVNSWVP